MSIEEELKELREEIIKLRERVYHLEHRPTTSGDTYGPIPSRWVEPSWTPPYEVICE